MRHAVLLGFSVFTREDALLAGQQLCARGSVRLKPAGATGGRGQSVIADATELKTALGSMDATELASHGLVLEENLVEVTTHSVGQVRVAELVISYRGTQRLTPDNHGEQVYGGSDLLVARGGFEVLLGLDLTTEARLAVAQAQAYDAATEAEFPGFFASRRNYDVVQGISRNGRECTGVLEQSWRIGGASPAEIAALEAFAADSRLRAMQVSSCESYDVAEPPAVANVHFRGIDGKVGAIVKYSVIESREYSSDQN